VISPLMTRDLPMMAAWSVEVALASVVRVGTGSLIVVEPFDIVGLEGGGGTVAVSGEFVCFHIFCSSLSGCS